MPKVIKNCPKCNQPLTPGNVKKEPYGSGKYSHRVHRNCPNVSVPKPQLRSPKPSHSHITDALPYVERELVSGSDRDAVVIIKPVDISSIVNSNFINRNPYRFFIDSVTLAKLNRIAKNGGQSATLSVMIVEASQPERDPETFKDITEIHFGGE